MSKAIARKSSGLETGVAGRTRSKTVAIILQVLNLPELVSTVFSYLAVEDIKTCARVNKLWHEEARRFLVKRTRLVIGGPGATLDAMISKYMNQMGNNCHEELKLDKAILQNNEEVSSSLTLLADKYAHMIRSLYLCIGDERLDIFGRLSLPKDMSLGGMTVLRGFFNVTSITVYLNYYCGLLIIPSDVRMHNVRKLSVEMDPDIESIQVIYDEVQICLAKDLLHMCPRIEEFVLVEPLQRPFLAELDHVLESRITSLEIKIPPKIIPNACFYLDMPLNGYISPFSNDMPFHLTVLKIDLCLEFPLWIDNVELLLEKFASTLQNVSIRLVLWIIDKMELRNIQIPIMRNLKKFRVTYRIVRDKWRLYQRQEMVVVRFIFAAGGDKIIYSEQFPALKKLVVKADEQEAEGRKRGSRKLLEMFLPEVGAPCKTLEHLDVDCVFSTIRCGRYCLCNNGETGNEANRDILERVAKAFPNVVELKRCPEILKQ